MKNSAFALSNLARCDSKKRTQLLEAGILESLLSLLNQDSVEDVVTEVSWVLSYLSARFDYVTFLLFSHRHHGCCGYVSLFVIIMFWDWACG